MKKRWLALIMTSLLVVGCGTTTVHTNYEVTPEELQKLKALERMSRSKEGDENNQIRFMALTDTALSVGARGGLDWRTKQINAQLRGEKDQLDEVFNFRALVLNENILPPVLVESLDSLNLETPHTIRAADRNYKIIKQARFITAPPMWQDYLIFELEELEEPDITLLPKNAEEREIWELYVKKGWADGVRQANMIYEENLSRLKRDYQGMIRYRVLLAQNIVSAPEVAYRDLGITGGGDELSINDRVLTIKALPALKADSDQWQPVVTR